MIHARARPPLRAQALRARAREAARYVATRRAAQRLAGGRDGKRLTRAITMGALFGIGLLVAAQLVAAATAAVDQVTGDVRRLMPSPVAERAARPSADAAMPNAVPILDALDRVTKESRVIVSGRVPSFALGGAAPRIEIVANGSLVASPAVDDQGRFSSTVALVPGTNTIVVAAVRGGVRAESSARTVTLRTTPPSLTIAKPLDGDTIDPPNVTVEGTTEPGVTVTVNGHATNVRADGTFSDSLSAPAGELSIEVVARDQAGNEAKKTLKLTVRPSGSALGVLVSIDRAKAKPGQSMLLDVLVSDSGRPLANANVTVSVGLMTLNGRTDGSGRYRVPFLAPATEGGVTVVALASGPTSTGRGSATFEVAK